MSESVQAPITEERLRSLLEDIVANDRSKVYEYGEKRDGDGASPRTGAAWNTPRQIARACLAELNLMGKVV